MGFLEEFFTQFNEKLEAVSRRFANQHRGFIEHEEVKAELVKSLLIVLPQYEAKRGAKSTFFWTVTKQAIADLHSRLKRYKRIMEPVVQERVTKRARDAYHLNIDDVEEIERAIKFEPEDLKERVRKVYKGCADSEDIRYIQTAYHPSSRTYDGKSLRTIAIEEFKKGGALREIVQRVYKRTKVDLTKVKSTVSVTAWELKKLGRVIKQKQDFVWME